MAARSEDDATASIKITSPHVLTERGRMSALARNEKGLKQVCREIESLSDQIEMMKEAGYSTQDVLPLYREWLQLYEIFLTLRSLLSSFGSGDDFVYRMTDRQLKRFKTSMENWILNLTKQPEVVVRAEDSVSQASGRKSSSGSRRSSSRSSVLSSRMKQEQLEAVLLAKRAALERKEQLEVAKVKLRLEEEKLDLNTELEIAKVQSHILGQYESRGLHSFEQSQSFFQRVKPPVSETTFPKVISPSPTVIHSTPVIDHNRSVKYHMSASQPIGKVSEITDTQLNDMPSPFVTVDCTGTLDNGITNSLDKYHAKDHVNPLNAKYDVNPLNAKYDVNPSNAKYDVNPLNAKDDVNPSNAMNASNSVFKTGKNEELVKTINDIPLPLHPSKPSLLDQLPDNSSKSESQVIVSVVRQLRKPVPDIKRFDGNPLEYRRFIRQFKTKVVKNAEDYDECLNYLDQFTSGEANKIVNGYAYLDSEIGYPAALNELNDRYGQDEVLANAFVKRALEWPAIKADVPKSLDEFSIFLGECENAVRSITAVKVLEYPENMRRIVSKLPFHYHDKWRNIVQKARENSELIEFHKLVNFVRTEARKINDTTYGRDAMKHESSDQKRPVQKAQFSKSKSSFAVGVNHCKPEIKQVTSRPSNNQTHTMESSFKQSTGNAFLTPCLYCSDPRHTLELCNILYVQPYPDRINFLKQHGLCFGCLRRGHLSKVCKGRLTCVKCNRRHPMLLHDETRSTSSSNSLNTSQNKDSTSLKPTGVCSHTEAGVSECTMAIIPVQVKLKKGHKAIQTYAFLDPGSSISFCTERLVHQLGGSGKPMNITLDTMGNAFKMNTSAVNGLQVLDLQFSNAVDLPVTYTKDKMPVSHVHIPRQEDIADWPHLKAVRLPEIDASIDLLIGNNVPDAYSPSQVCTGPQGTPHATKTRLGWVVWGMIRPNLKSCENFPVNRIELSALKEAENLKDLDRLVRHSFNHDFPENSIDDKKELSQEDKTFMDRVDKSICIKDGHYYIDLPFKRKDVLLPNNRIQAKKRLESLERKLRRSPKFQADYNDFMHKVFEQGYAEKVPVTELNRTDGRVWYIPHHGVYHPKKPEKVRVVFDCTASYAGVSLNQILLQGPDLTNTLIGVLLRFRQERVAVIGDIESMYYQVRVPKKDCDCLRFLWWPDGDLNQEPEDCRMRVHLFGAVSSPSCASFALQRTGEDNPDFDDDARATVKRGFYVDDCLASRPTEKETISLVHETMSLCAAGGFKLTKWTSNSRIVLDSIPPEHRQKDVKELNLEAEELPNQRALGVYWFVETDTLGFKLQIPSLPPTRRGILAIVSSVYDPLGFVAPLILIAKCILQELCRNNISWDEEITGQLSNKWQLWIEDLQAIEKVKIPRCFKPASMKTIASCEVHNFADASNLGYGVVSYLRMTDVSGQIFCAFLHGKARVTPLKKITIPRLELTAATVAVRLTKMLVKEIDYPISKVYFWTDSMTTLRYIRNESSRFHTFIANRVTTIREGSRIQDWRYVPSNLNPADYASRGLRMKKFLMTTEWFQGPDFMWQPIEKWPRQPDNLTILPEDDPEVKTTNAVTVKIDPFEALIQHYSTWKRLKKAVAFMILFSRYLRGKGHDKPTKVTVEILHEAELALIRYVQGRHFEEENRALISSCKLSKSSVLRKLDPVLVDGLIRVGGRLARANIAYEAKHQLILPKVSKVSRLLIEDAHRSVGHLGRNAILALMQQKYWLIGANSVIKKMLSRCVTCRRYQAPALEQKMADLPPDRVMRNEAPFTRVGMDFFGPFEVKRGRCQVKRYGVIFTCLAIRAVHIEIAHSLDTDSCICAIRRFVARRGPVEMIRSDNGTNIVGAEKELREEIQKWNQGKIDNFLKQQSITWVFNPPTASHFGGVWERLIRSIRKVLYSLMREQTVRLDDECLHTLMCEVEAILNGRPISTVPDSPTDFDALTPNHLLFFRSGEQFPPGTFSRTDSYVRRRWRQVQYLADVFWQRWVKEYLPLLQQRQKWLYPKRNLSVGDIVLVIDNSPRNAWSLGKVLDVFYDKNGFVRSAKLRTKASILERPAAKLCLVLEADD